MEADKEKYLTQSAYTRREAGELSPNHEDFIEMICRMGDMPVRIKNLSQWLGVSPSVASRSASALRDLGYCTFEKYGFVTLTDKGRKTGRYLTAAIGRWSGCSRSSAAKRSLRKWKRPSII